MSMTKTSPENKTLILYGTQTGTAEDLAEELAESLSSASVENRVENMFDIEIAEVCDFKNVVTIVSTWGDGDPPDDAEALHSEFEKADEDAFSEQNFAVFGLGDTGYEQFCKCGIDFDNFLEKGGGSRLVPRVDADIDYEDDFENWKSAVTAILEQQ